jgi:AAA15 family ATPase/GTPase
VNLITGKNNTGKSSLLEAIALYVTKCDLSLLIQLLEERGENLHYDSETENIIDKNIKAFASLFTNRTVYFSKSDAIVLEIKERNFKNNPIKKEKYVALRFVKYFDEINRKTEESNGGKERIIFGLYDDRPEVDSELGLEIQTELRSIVLSLQNELYYRRFGLGLRETNNFQYVVTRNIDRGINGKLWDKITLTDKEQYVLEALKIIEPNVERIAFIDEGNRNRSAVIKLANNNVVLPLKSMGDGINRILTIILALVNAENGYLLIDEFENGLHHSVQEKLWEIIFSLANKLNIQVFATTHSEDCIAGFEYSLNNHSDSNDGKLIRLENKKGQIKQVAYTKEELKIAVENNIETR